MHTVLSMRIQMSIFTKSWISSLLWNNHEFNTLISAIQLGMGGVSNGFIFSWWWWYLYDQHSYTCCWFVGLLWKKKIQLLCPLSLLYTRFLCCSKHWVFISYVICFCLRSVHCSFTLLSVFFMVQRSYCAMDSHISWSLKNKNKNKNTISNTGSFVISSPNSFHLIWFDVLSAMRDQGTILFFTEYLDTHINLILHHMFTLKTSSSLFKFPFPMDLTLLSPPFHVTSIIFRHHTL